MDRIRSGCTGYFDTGRKGTWVRFASRRIKVAGVGEAWTIVEGARLYREQLRSLPHIGGRRNARKVRDLSRERYGAGTAPAHRVPCDYQPMRRLPLRACSSGTAADPYGPYGAGANRSWGAEERRRVGDAGACALARIGSFKIELAFKSWSELARAIARLRLMPSSAGRTQRKFRTKLRALPWNEKVVGRGLRSSVTSVASVRAMPHRIAMPFHGKLPRDDAPDGRWRRRTTRAVLSLSQNYKLVRFPEDDGWPSVRQFGE